MTIIFDGTNGITSPGGDTANTSYTSPIVKSPSSLSFRTNGNTTAMTIDTSQNVGIGTTTPTTKLQVTNVADGHIANFIGGSASSVTVGIFGTTAANFGSIGTRTNNGFNIYTNDVDRIRVDSTGRVNMPFQPMFSGHRNNGNISAGSVVIINTPDIDVGNNYNYANGRFTCPITGVYEVHTCGHSENSQPSQLRITKNGVTVKQEYQNGAAYGTTPVTIIMNCSAGDYIEVYVQTGVYWGGDITGVRLTVKLVA